MMLRPKDLCQGSGTKTFLEAMQSGKVHLARFVLDALDGRIINGKAENGRTLLMHAVCLQEHASRSKFTQLLLEKGADVNTRDDHGRTALSLACEHGHLDSVKLLVQFNADPELTDTWGNSALMYAACGGHSQILEFLIRAFKKLGLRLDRTNHAGHSAIQVADFFGHNQCVQTLNGCGKKIVSPTNSTGEPAEDLRWPNRLPKQVLDRFSKQIQSKHEEILPALFQRELCVSDSNSLRIRFRRPDANQSLIRSEDGGADLLFASKQIQNLVLKEDGSTEPETDGDVPHRGKTRSFNLDLRTGRKQSYQGDVQETNRSASKFKRASLQDEKPLVAKFYSTKTTDNFDVSKEVQKRGSVPKTTRQSKLLFSREELEPERIKPRSSGLSRFGNRLLRRFTAPEFMRHITDYPRDAGHGKGKMSRSETFPFSHTHMRVNSQPSVDSISAVRCEFESNPALK
ncbi:ankyrin repeat and SAM domain-containing protein 4B [Carassius gibelio]|uniref:ankyrin repeat and SAM domain-containing protein 4B n=1 Tax=Carassius gibelio TaxID=101364 RepID=UPI0022777AA8|nr:ankyrin repeat and SAM domain-containing protein 4B [Carassius gibelio]